jgi:hypothetical protein
VIPFETLTWPEGHDLIDCNLSGHGYTNLLSTQKCDNQHSLKGNIDVVVAEKADAKSQAIIREHGEIDWEVGKRGSPIC